MKKNLPFITLIGLGLIIIAGGIVAVVFGHAWIPIIYFAVGLVIALIIVVPILSKDNLNRDMLWLFIHCVVYGTALLVITFFMIIFCTDIPHPAIE